MSFKTDAGGFAFKCEDVKLQGGSSSWLSRLSQLGRMQGCVRLITYSLPDLESIRRVLSKRPENIFIIANPRAANVESRAEEIKKEFPNIRIALNSETHSKVVLIEPDSLMVSSANFGMSGWHETTVSFHQKDAHDYYLLNEFDPLWRMSDEVVDQGAEQLESLFFIGPKYTDELMEAWEIIATVEPAKTKLSNVLNIYLDNAKITDEGLVHLKGFTKVETLELRNTEITDSGLMHLSGLTNLKVLDLYKTKVTDAGVQELQKALPDCRIYHNAEALSV